MHRFSLIRDRIVTPILYAKEHLIERSESKIDEKDSEAMNEDSNKVSGLQRRLQKMWPAMEDEKQRMMRKRTYR